MNLLFAQSMIYFKLYVLCPHVSGLVRLQQWSGTLFHSQEKLTEETDKQKPQTTREARTIDGNVDKHLFKGQEMFTTHNSSLKNYKTFYSS